MESHVHWNDGRGAWLDDLPLRFRAMRGTINTVAAAGALTLALAGTAVAGDFLPYKATYDGKTNHGGALGYKVKRRDIILITGSLPLPKGQTCQYADERRIPLHVEERDPVGNGPFKIRATQRVNPHTSDWRRLELRIAGQFTSDAEKASGDLRAKLFDRHGKCATRSDLTWHVHRTS